MKVIILLVSALLFAANAQCAVYKWTDKNGKIHYSENKPESMKSRQIELVRHSYVAPVVHEKVIMYATSWCGYCKKARRYFSKNNIPFIEYDIERDLKAKARYKKLGGSGVPLIVYGKKRMTGFNDSQFKRLYEN